MQSRVNRCSAISEVPLLFRRRKIRFAGGASMFVLLACLALAGPALARNEAEQSWLDRRDAGAAYSAAAAETATARSGLTAIDRNFEVAAANLANENETYLEAMDRYYDLLRQMEVQYVLRIQAEAIPEALSAERRELKRQYDILINYRNYVTDAFFKEIEDGLKAKVREIAEMKRSGRRRIENEIKPEIERLRTQRAEAFREILRLSNVNYDRSLTTRWFDAAQTLYEAERLQAEAKNEAEVKAAAFITTLAEASPPFLQAVRLTAGAESYYDFAWIREGYEDDVTASIEYSRQRAQIAENLPNYERVHAEVKNERKQLSLRRWGLAKQMHRLSSELAGAAEDYGDAQRNKVIAVAVADMAVSVAEVAFTGGVATAVRKAEELAEQATLVAIRRGNRFRSEAERYVSRNVRARLHDAFEGVGVEQYRKLAELVSARRGLFILARNSEEMLVAVRRRYGDRFSSVSEAWASIPPSAAEDIVMEVSRELEQRANIIFPSVNRNDFIKDFMPPQELRDRIRRFLTDFPVDGIESGGVLRETTAIYAAYAGSGSQGLVPDADPTDVADIFGGKAVEWVIGTGIDGSVQLLRHSLSVPAVRAQVSQIGAFGRQMRMSAVFSAIGASAKILVSHYYEGQIHEAHAQFWGMYAQLTAMHQYYYEMLKADEELAPVERSYRTWAARGRAYLAEIGLARRAGGDMPEPQSVPPEATTVTIALDFSTPLTVAPIVQLGSDALDVEGDGSHWRATYKVPLLVRKLGWAQLSVTTGRSNQTYADLDSKPKTIAYVPFDKEKWIGYDRGADTKHKLHFAPVKATLLRAKFGDASEELEVR